MRRLYDCELADILYIPPIRMGGVNLFTILAFTILAFTILSFIRLQRYNFFLNYANKKLIFPAKSKKGRKEIQKNRL